MAEVKNTFVKSKMNKDLDDRLVPAGEYRDAQNVAVAKSEGPNVGALENILGNNLIAEFLPGTGADEIFNVEIIGYFMDVKNDRIIVFMTNYVDTSSDSLTNFSPAGAYHGIGVYNLKTLVSSIIVSGRFLNFSKTHEIYGVNVIDDLLFWTDNRNQPRKINIDSAIETPNYYTIEDTISVSKYYPYSPIDLIKNLVVGLVGLPVPGSGYTTNTNVATAGGTGTGLTLDLTLGFGGAVNIAKINNVGVGYTDGDVVSIIEPFVGGGFGASVQLVVEVATTMTDVVSDYLPFRFIPGPGSGIYKNPYRQPYATNAILTPPEPPLTWPGDPEYLKDKFVRFSYRFKFDDDEYSLIAPFTQTCFVPLKDGYFMDPGGVGLPGQFDNDDVVDTYKSTEVDLMQNKINNIELIINSPLGNWADIEDTMKIKEVDILYKQAGQNVVKVITTINRDELSLVDSTFLVYNYKSNKPWKTLPDKDILRVHDQVPVRALAQEVIDNRVVYGNYIDKPTSPSYLNYSCNVASKDQATQIEYQNQNLKQNRTYQVGVVLSDRYGRQSTVILSTLDDGAYSDLIKGSTLFNKYKESPFSETGGLFTGSTFLPTPAPGDVWDGDNLEITFWNAITSLRNSNTGEPGLYDATTNPLGWYSYKIVVKQQEQDYYNVYFPGILNGYISGEAIATPASFNEPVCHIALHADNINKIPRDLSLVGPNQNTFRTSRPSIEEDPLYYRFNGQLIDPFSTEGEVLLKQRDRERDLDSGSQITNASVKLSLRLNSGLGNPATNPASTYQAYPGSREDIVTTIGTGSELGLWDPGALPPFNTANVFYGYKNNPYIAKLNVSAPLTTGLKGPHPESGVLKFVVVSTSAGADYIAGSKNIPCTIPTTAGFTISGFKVNIPASPITAQSLEIASIGTGWPSVIPASFSIGGCTISGAGNSGSSFTIYVSSENSNGEMEPSLAVYETKPVSSELDIFWETSTNGLVNELNDEILNGDVTTPVEIKDNGLNPIKYDGFGNSFFYWIDEGLTSGSFITSPLYAFNTLGNPLPTIASSATTFSLISVFDGNNTNRTSEFLLENSPAFFGTIPNTFNIKTNSTFVVLSNNNVTGSFTFNINVNTAGPTWVSDGQMINRTLTLAPSGGLVTTLVNIVPQVVPVTPWSYVVSTTPSTKLFTLQGYNGSVIGGGKEFEDLTWEMVRYSGGTPIPVPELYFVPVGLNTGLVELWLSNTATSAMDSSNPGIGDYYLRLVDGGGLDGGGLYFSLTVI